MDAYVVKCAGSGMAVLFEQLARSSDTRIEFIDSLCTVIKLSVLTYKKNGSRLSIKNNIISIQEPSYLQGVQRWMNSDERDQLHQLRSPILYFKGLQLGYITLEDLTFDLDLLTSITEVAIKGLSHLKTTYESARKGGSMVKNCLDDYIKILSHKYAREEYFNETASIGKTTLFVIYNEFIKKWKLSDLQIIMQLFILAESKNSENMQNEIANAIDHLVISKDLEIDSIRPD